MPSLLLIFMGLLISPALAGPLICTLCNSNHGCCQALFTSGIASCVTPDGDFKISLSSGPNRFIAMDSSGGNVSLFLPNQTTIKSGWQDTTFILSDTASVGNTWTDLVNVTRGNLFCDSQYGCCVLKNNKTCNIGSSGTGQFFGGYDAQCPVTGKSIGFDRRSISSHYVQTCAVENNGIYWQHWSVSTTGNVWSDDYSFVCQ